MREIWNKIRIWSTSVCSHYLYVARRICAKTAVPALVDPYVIQCAKLRPFVKYGSYEGNSIIGDSFAKYSSYEQMEYICKVTEATLVEPRYGFVVTKEGRYFKESLPYCDDASTPPPFLLDERCDRNLLHLNEAISIRYGWNNYWHFLNDAIGTLLFLHDQGCSMDIPIIVPEQALHCHFVREVLNNHVYFKGLNFVFQSSNQWIECKSIWFGKVLPNTKDNLLNVNRVIDIKDSPTERIYEKIFLTRRGGRRPLSNVARIENIAAKLGFTVVDTTQLNVTVQKKLFASAKTIVGLHGAGLANLMFSYGSARKVLEIFPGSSIPPHYYWLSRELGYDYRAIYGSNPNKYGEFSVNENVFSEEVENL